MKLNRHGRWRFLFFLIAIGILTRLVEIPSWNSSQAASRNTPNILFILTDDQRWDTLGISGNEGIRTPMLDRLGREGAVFTEGYVASPLCCPSRASFLTGLYPHQTGILRNKGEGKPTSIPKGIPTVAHFLRQAGYVTGFIGKQHLEGNPRDWGFDEVQHHEPPQAVRYLNPSLTTTNSEIEADLAIDFIKKHRGESWFLWLATNAPHLPFHLHPDFPYRAEEITPPPGWTDPTFVLDSQWARYYSTISHLDSQLGRVMEALNQVGLTENTVVIFTSDNGYMLGQHGIPEKRVWFEPSVRVPFLMRWPGHIAPETGITTPVSSIDLLPTLLDIAQVPVQLSEQYEGTSILPALGLRVGQIREVVYSEVEFQTLTGPILPVRPFRLWQMVKWGGYKYVWIKGEEEHLYDLSTDPREVQDLVDTSSAKDILQELRSLRDRWLSRTIPVVR